MIKSGYNMENDKLECKNLLHHSTYKKQQPPCNNHEQNHKNQEEKSTIERLGEIRHF
jgi:hypothetical protein